MMANTKLPKRRRPSAAIGDHPGTAIAVAATVGAIAAAVLPTSRGEVRVIRPIAKTARTILGKAFAIARTTGLQGLAGSGLTSATISSGVAGLVSAALKARKKDTDSRR